MRTAGIVMIVLSAFGGYGVYCRTVMQKLQLIRTLTEDLALLRCQICIHRRPLPAILDSELCHGSGGTYLWKSLAELLRRSEGTVQTCWEKAVSGLPEEVAVRLVPLGRLLPVGGEPLARAIDEVREELVMLARERQERQSVELRLSAAVCFSVTALFLIIFI